MDSHLLRIQPDLSRVSTDYLVTVLSSDELVGAQVRSLSHGSIMAGLSSSIVRRFRVPLPPLPEQQRIAEILDTLDEAIRKTEQVIAKLQQVKQGLLHDLLTRGIDEHGELRDPDRHPEQFKDSELGRVPRAWEVTTIGGVFSIQSGLSLGPHRRPTSRSVAYLRVGNVFRGRIDFSDVARFDATSAELAERRIEAGDLLVVEGHANVDEIGRVARADDRAQGMTFQNHLFRLRSVRAESRFSELFLNCQMVRSYWRRVCSTSSGLNTINQSLLRGVPFLLPPEGEQVRIVAAETATSARIVGLLNELAKLQSLKSGLMHDLLTGRVRTAPHER
jgi:type I restriction enzyme S subunit